MIDIILKIRNRYEMIINNRHDVSMDFDNIHHISVDVDFDNSIQKLKLRSILDKKLIDIMNLKLKDILFEGVINNG